MKTTRTLISLFAGFFCFYSTAGCLSRTGEIISVLTLGSDCPSVGSSSYIMEENDKCEIVPTSDWICAIDSNGEAFGGPYRFTGNIVTDPDQPNPTDPNAAIKTPDRVAVAYQADPSRSVTEFSEKMSSALNTLSLNQKSLSVESQQNKHQILDVMGQYNTQMANRVTGARDTVLSLRDYIIQQETIQSVKSDASFQKVYDKQDVAQQSLDSISTTIQDLNLSASLENIEANIGGFYNELNYVMIGQNQSATRETELNSKTDALRNISLSAYDVSLDNRSSLQQLSSDVYQLSYQISEISDMLQDDNPPPSCGGMMEPPCEPCGGILGPECPPDGGDTGGSFSSLDSQNLQTVADSSLETVQAVRSVGRGIDNVENALGELGQKLDSINSTLQDGTGSSPAGDTVAHGKLDGIASTLDTISESLSGTIPDGSVAGNSISLPDYQKGLDDGYSAITQAIDAQSESLEKITGITNELKSYASLSDFFRLAQSSCQPIDFGSNSMDLCAYTPTIRTVLTWVFYMLTALFMIKSFHQTIQNMRL